MYISTDVQKGSCGLEDVDAICAVANSGDLYAAYKMLDQVYEKCGSLDVKPPPEYIHLHMQFLATELAAENPPKKKKTLLDKLKK